MSRRRTPLFTGMVAVVALVAGLPTAALAAFTAVGMNTAPATAATFPAPGAPTANGTATGVNLSWTGTQLSTGRNPDGYEVRRTIGATTTVVCTTTSALSCTDSKQTQAVTYKVVAKVGNWTSSSANTSFTPDTTAPTSTFSVNPAVNGLGWVQSTAPAITIAATDAGGSGVNNISYKVGAASTVTTNGNSVNFTLSQQGTVAIQYWATDNVGNVESTKSITLKIDGIAPPINGLAISTDTGSANNDFITNTAAQTLSGTTDAGQSVTVVYNGVTKTATANGAGAWSVILTLAEGAKNAVITATDGAGNTTSVTKSIRLDTVAPTLTVTDPDAGASYNDNSWNATCAPMGGPGICGTSADAGGSGPDEVTYELKRTTWYGSVSCWNGSSFGSGACGTMRDVTTGPTPWWTSVPTASIPNNFLFASSYKLTVTVTDLAGNATTSTTNFTY